jgi:hypothetical protein
MISTPRNPTASAIQRFTPTGSFRKCSEASVANSGAEKLIAVTPAIGIRPRAMSCSVCETVCDTPRSRCAPGRAVRNTFSPWIGATNAVNRASETKERKNSTSPTG